MKYQFVSLTKEPFLLNCVIYKPLDCESASELILRIRFKLGLRAPESNVN